MPAVTIANRLVMPQAQRPDHGPCGRPHHRSVRRMRTRRLPLGQPWPTTVPLVMNERRGIEQALEDCHGGDSAPARPSKSLPGTSPTQAQP